MRALEILSRGVLPTSQDMFLRFRAISVPVAVLPESPITNLSNRICHPTYKSDLDCPPSVLESVSLLRDRWRC